MLAFLPKLDALRTVYQYIEVGITFQLCGAYIYKVLLDNWNCLQYPRRRTPWKGDGDKDSVKELFWGLIIVLFAISISVDNQAKYYKNTTYIINQ